MQTIIEKMGGTYRWENGYRIPDLEPPEDIEIGLWGQRQAEDMLFQLVTQFQKIGGVTEELKAADQMEWVRRMNSIRHRAEEIVYKELIWV